MSTRHYLRLTPHSRVNERIQTLLVHKDYDNAISMIEKLKTGIYIGTTTQGWKFRTFVRDKKYYESNKESFLKYVEGMTKNGFWYICDEYGNEETFSELKNIIENASEGYDLKSYRDENPQYSYNIDEIVVDGIRFSENPD